MLGQCWHAVYDVGPALTQNWLNVSSLLGCLDPGVPVGSLSSEINRDDPWLLDGSHK